jgi:hypothetical protein
MEEKESIAPTFRSGIRDSGFRVNPLCPLTSNLSLIKEKVKNESI